jgi:hypothetical protein
MGNIAQSPKSIQYRMLGEIIGAEPCMDRRGRLPSPFRRTRDRQAATKPQFILAVGFVAPVRTLDGRLSCTCHQPCHKNGRAIGWLGVSPARC